MRSLAFRVLSAGGLANVNSAGRKAQISAAFASYPELALAWDASEECVRLCSDAERPAGRPGSSVVPDPLLGVAVAWPCNRLLSAHIAAVLLCR